MQNTKQLSGILIFISFLITIVSYFLYSELFIYSGIFAWLALSLVFIKTSNKKLLIVLLILSFLSFSYSFLNDFFIDYERAILVNQYLLTLLIGVGFLRLIATPKKEKVKKLPRGKESFLKTYLGIHLFGSVINLSSLILVADKLYKKGPISKLQIILLTRAFSSDAYWSPFFVAFAAALTYAPNLSTSTILLTGLVLAFIAFLVTYFEVMNIKKYDIKEFRGYPIHFETLYLPFLLAIMVLFTNFYYPNLKVILLISFFSIVLTTFILPLKVGLKNTISKLNHHVTDELPKMKNEIALFLVAGMFGVSISSILVGLNINLPFETFNGLTASLLLLVLIILSFVGIHPIISIAIIGNWMNELNHTLLAMTFLMSWSTAVSTSPFSGLNLTMQARYKLNAIDIFKINLPYVIRMYIVCIIVLFVVSDYLNL
ncbi:tellurium resistance protein TerC [Arcobacter sp. LA11]|uniref:tellurium resistance protein TerC n=1 Tax=Arcobacter sp. LA11 TaxID=1898176 RepID=UPI000934FEFF|nr:tellurium resistance protein TerC [Arcobacter sp. LA11]